MRPVMATLLAAAFLLPLSATAAPMHMDRKVEKTPTGAKISFMLRSDRASHPHAHIGIHEPATVTANNGSHELRGKLDRMNQQYSARVVTPCNQVCPSSIEINYAKHGFKAGQTVRLVSTWQANAAQLWHVWGQESGDDFQLP